MTSNLATRFEEDEIPTKPIEAMTSRTLTTLARIDRLAALCAERLAVEPDPDAIAAAADDIAQIRSLAGSVLR